MTEKNLALVLHRINLDLNEKFNFEDIHIDIFKQLLELVSNSSSKYNYIITFDDGNLSDYTLAFKELQNKELNGIFFIVPEWINKKNHLTWSNVKEMSKYGMVFGSHSLSHPKFNNLSSDQCDIELMESKSIIEDQIGVDVKNFAFPFGIYNNMSVRQAINAGYKNIFTSKHGIYQDNEILRPRNSLNLNTTYNDILKTLHPNEVKQLSWYLEDVLKDGVKQLVGIDRYKKIRDLIF